MTLLSEIKPNDWRPSWARNLTSFSNTLAFHLAHPEENVNTYIKRKNIELGLKVVRKKRVYLDQNHWLFCRDAKRGTPQNKLHTRMYELLQQGVKEEKLICPASHVVLEETLKQTDAETRAVTAEVVDKLSKGVTLQPAHVLEQTEFLHFLASTPASSTSVHALDELAWTHTGNVMGTPLPVVQGLDELTLAALQKDIFDLISALPFSVLIDALSPKAGTGLISSDFYKNQNEESQKHRSGFSSFKQVFLEELAGCLDYYTAMHADGMIYWWRKKKGGDPSTVTPKEFKEGGQQINNLIYLAFQFNRIQKQLPGLRIMAGIHAAIRYKRQKHKPGDIHDHFHARVALPYCNLFLTERSLGSLLTSKPLNYDKLYGCRVAWEPEAALQEIKTLLNYSST